MNARRASLALVASLAAAACSSAPPKQPDAPPVPVRKEAPPTTLTPPNPPPQRQLVKLDNGMSAVLTTIAAGRQATLQFAFLAGSAFMAPGAAELAAQVLVDSSDASQGRGSLRQTIGRLGGTLAVHVGPLTTWIDVRVPGNRWRDAAVAMRKALDAPTQSRHQIERIRSDFVSARTAWIRQDPTVAMAQLLLLAESSSASYLLSLLDRDPSEVSLFQSRLFQPDRALITIEANEPTPDLAAALGKTGAAPIGGWLPAPPIPGPAALLDRKFESGLYWSPGKTAAEKAARCRVALVMLLPSLGQPDAAELLMLHACFTLDGTGGRLEQLQRERGLGHVRWRSDLAQTPDATAILLTAEVLPQEVAALWQTIELARNSLQVVPPSDSEITLARTRVPLTARLPALDDGARVRSTTMLLLRGSDFFAIDRRLAEIAALPGLDLSVPTAAFLAQPFALVAIGGEPPADLPAVRRFDVLPPGDDEQPKAPTEVIATSTAAAATPWLERARAAIGGSELLRRLDGWTSEAKLLHDEAPVMTEATTWRATGALQRTRTLLGQSIDTTLAGTAWSERSGTTTRSLDAREAALLRREHERHPLALLSLHARGELSFRRIAQRDAGDRTVVVLEAEGNHFDRLRLHIDTQSHLVRVVETWETLVDGTVVHLRDTWSDYRASLGVRTPFRRLQEIDDGQNRVETVFAKWAPRFTAP